MAEETKPKTAAPAPKAKKSGAKIDLASIGGLALALTGILGGLMIEGGRLKDVAQFTAAMIVLGGTIGAVLVSTPLAVALGAAKRFAGVFRDESKPLDEMLEEVIQYAAKARKNGLVSLEQDADAIQDPFLKKALNLAVDGTDLQELRKMLELEIEMEEQHVEAEAKVFESAGGYAPTIGIIGAVLGLIQVMKNLANIEEVGHGIAVAFVATVYGVGSANLLFLPAASKIKARFAAEVHRKEMIVEAISGIVEGLNPKLIRLKLEAYVPPAPAKKAKKEKAPAVKPAAAPAKG
ncbi:MAG TPA: flagellar motor protein [Bryobacteraceae bacterium]|nr:flagellar motor protein [Bryobacteraceae bacterium]